MTSEEKHTDPDDLPPIQGVESRKKKQFQAKILFYLLASIIILSILFVIYLIVTSNILPNLPIVQELTKIIRMVQ